MTLFNNKVSCVYSFYVVTLLKALRIKYSNFTSFTVWHDNAGQYAITVKGDERHVEECADRCNVAPSWCRRQLRVAGIGERERERFEVLGSA